MYLAPKARCLLGLVFVWIASFAGAEVSFSGETFWPGPALECQSAPPYDVPLFRTLQPPPRKPRANDSTFQPRNHTVGNFVQLNRAAAHRAALHGIGLGDWIRPINGNPQEDLAILNHWPLSDIRLQTFELNISSSTSLMRPNFPEGEIDIYTYPWASTALAAGVSTDLILKDQNDCWIMVTGSEIEVFTPDWSAPAQFEFPPLEWNDITRAYRWEKTLRCLTEHQTRLSPFFTPRMAGLSSENMNQAWQIKISGHGSGIHTRTTVTIVDGAMFAIQVTAQTHCGHAIILQGVFED